MRALLLLGLLFAGQAHAIGIECDYEEQACDEAGDHFHCYVYGWAVGEYCSATDDTKPLFPKRPVRPKPPNQRPGPPATNLSSSSARTLPNPQPRSPTNELECDPACGPAYYCAFSSVHGSLCKRR